MLMLASLTFGDALLTVLERGPDLSGWGKVGWLLLIVILPLVGVLIYPIARGHKMTEHAVTHARAQDAAFRDYVRSAVASPADDLAKRQDLKERGQRASEWALA